MEYPEMVGALRTPRQIVPDTEELRGLARSTGLRVHLQGVHVAEAEHGGSHAPGQTCV